MSLKGKIILVTGATSGIGLALVQRLHRLGTRPVLTGRNGKKVAGLAREIGVSGYKLDVTLEKECSAVVAQIEQDEGPIHGLVNNAGIWLEGDLRDALKLSVLQRGCGSWASILEKLRPICMKLRALKGI